MNYTEQLAAQLKRVGQRVDSSNEFIYLVVNLALIVVMFFGNVVYYGHHADTRIFCQRTSGFFLQLISITFLLLRFGYG